MGQQEVEAAARPARQPGRRQECRLREAGSVEWYQDRAKHDPLPSSLPSRYLMVTLVLGVSTALGSLMVRMPSR